MIRQRNSILRTSLVLSAGVSLVFLLTSVLPAQVSGELQRWHRVTLSFEGPQTAEAADPNPFLDYRLGVKLTHPESGERVVVPGFYAADGNSAESSATEGAVWQAHFAPPMAGSWEYEASFRTGPNIALSGDPEAGEPAGFDGETGDFEVAPSDKSARDFRAKGTLRHVGEHYLRFASGERFLKGGADSPENFLGYADFDGTSDTAVHGSVETDDRRFLHAYAPHLGDWREGDPGWKDSRGKGIIGALNYLASKGMNSVYFLTYNLDGGDGKDTWMWTGPEIRDRFDVSKLAQWEIVFEHMDKLGILLHVITHEAENDEELGGGPDLNDVRKLYLRELVARFSHHPAIVWNLGEENDMPDADRKEIAAYIRDLDPYDHPITVHTKNKRALTFYDGLLGDPHFDATSIQGLMEESNKEAIELRRRSAAAGRPWAIFHDEQTPAGVGVLPDAEDPDHDLPRSYLWGNLLGGGSGVEWYFGYRYPHMDLNAEDWRSRENMWDQTRYALEFFHQHLNFWEMEPTNDLLRVENGYVFAKKGQVYVVYLPSSEDASLSLEEGDYTVRWYDPRSGGALQQGSVESITGPGEKELGAPPADPSKDWVALLKRSQ